MTYWKPKDKNDLLKHMSVVEKIDRFFWYRTWFIHDMNKFIDINIKSSKCRDIIDRQDFSLDKYWSQVIESCLIDLIQQNISSRPHISYLQDKIESIFSFLNDYENNYQTIINWKQRFLESEKFWPIEILYVYIWQIIDYLYFLKEGNDNLIKIKETRNKLIIHDFDETRYVKSSISTINNEDIFFEYGLKVYMPWQQEFTVYISPLKDLYILLSELLQILDEPK